MSSASDQELARAKSAVTAPLVASAAIAIGWTLLVHRHPAPFFPLASALCLAWIAASAWALRADLKALLRRPSLVEFLAALGSALVLFVGARAFLWATCGGMTSALCDDTHRVYAAFDATDPWAPWSLALIIAPAEELFWRGALLSALRSRLGSAKARGDDGDRLGAGARRRR